MNSNSLIASEALKHCVPAQAFKDMLSEKTKIVALVHVSNMLGSLLDTDFVAEETRKVTSLMLISLKQGL